MSRIPSPQIQVKPSNDMMTALLGAAVVAMVIAGIVVFMRGRTLGIF